MKNDKNCKYEIKVTVGHKLDGSAIRKSFYGKSKREAKAKAEEYIIEHGRTAKDPAENILYSELVQMYLEDRSRTVRQNTLNTYRLALEKTLPEFGSRKIKTITKRDLSAFAELLSGKYAQDSIRLMMTTVTSVFAYAIDNQFLTVNPCRGIRFKSKKETLQKNVYSEEDAERILAYTLEHPERPEGISIHIMLSYGTTVSETLGIQPGDIDFRAGTIYIQRSVTYSKGKVYVDEPKNKHRKRIIAVSEESLEYIRKVYDPAALYLVHEEKDKPFDPYRWRSQIYRPFMESMQQYYAAQGIQISILNPHELRHTRATIWVNNDINLFAIAEEMGWSDLQMLRKVYGHPDIQKVKGMLGIK